MTKVETVLSQYNNYKGYKLQIPIEARCLFPTKQQEFTIKTCIGDLQDVYVSEPPSHRRPHIHIPKEWVQASKLSHKDAVVIEVTEFRGVKQYRI